MSDIYVPGLKSRFDTNKLVDDLMKVERIPKERSEKNIENLQAQKTYWQDLGRRITALRDSARFLYSFQNPFNDRVVNSSDPSVLSATSNREAVEQEYNFTVKQIARADRFLSDPLDDSFKISEGTYTFVVGQDTLTFPFRGGSLREFTDILNRRGRDKVGASLIAVQPGKKTLLIESKKTGEENRLVFLDAAETLGVQAGLIGEMTDSAIIPLLEDVVQVKPGETTFIPLDIGASLSRNMLLQFEIATGEGGPSEKTVAEESINSEDSTGEAESSEQGASPNEALGSSAIIPAWTPLEPPVNQPLEPEPVKQIDNMHVLYLTFSDGTNRALPPIKDSVEFSSYQYRLFDVAGDKNIVSLEMVNQNTHRHVSIQNIRLLNPDVVAGNVAALKPISEAQDAILTMEGIEIKRPTNAISDLIPGVTINPKAQSDTPITLKVEPDRGGIKDSIITFVANYNRLIAEINVLIRNDDRIIQELTYLSEDEQEALRKRLGVFAGDSILGQFRTTLQRVATTPYMTSTDQDVALLAQIGIGTDVRGSGGSGYDPARLRGYLEIDEKILDAALETNLPTIQQLFGYDSDGDLIIDSGVAYTFESLAKPYTEIGGIIALKTGSIDSRIAQENRRIETLDRQLAAKEASLKSQYGQMEGAYNRMERMNSSLDQFSQQQNNNR
ncbi:MAG: flagellar filament capping protein FliD [Treponema sp.]|jgi:flagellar hook-associated protein 2|nr:flagellar filament capping protein FliD [Treponema sp.]